MLMGTISIAGLPPFSGFYSKDALLHEVFLAATGTGSWIYWLLYALAVITAAMTAYYMFRLYFLTFEGKFRGPGWMAKHHAEPVHDAEESTDHEHHQEVHLHEAPWAMTTPLVILGTMALIGGVVAFAIAGGPLGGFIHASEGTAEAASQATGVDVEAHGADGHGLMYALVHPFAEVTTYVSIAAAVIGIATAWAFWRPGKVESSIRPDSDAKGIVKVWRNRYYIDGVYDRIFGYGVLRQADRQDRFDQEVIDGTVNGVANASSGLGERLRKWNTGFVQDYALTMLFGFIVIVLVVIYWPQVPDLLDRVRNLATGFWQGGI